MQTLKQNNIKELYKKFKLQTLYIEMRSNIYLIVSRVAKFGFNDEKLRNDVEK